MSFLKFLPPIASALFCLAFYPQLANSASIHDLHMVGSIDNRYAIKMTLHAHENRLDGSYYYTRIGTPLALAGYIDGWGRITLDEVNNDRRKTGHFDGKLVKNKRIVGTWRGPNRSSEVEFLLIIDGDTTGLDGGEDGVLISQAIKQGTNANVNLQGWQIVSPVLMKGTLADDSIAQSIQSLLTSQQRFPPQGKMTESQTIYFDWLERDNYEVTYNENFLLGATFACSGWGAHLSNRTTRILINTRTGKAVAAKDAFVESSLDKLKAELAKRVQEIAEDQMDDCRKHPSDYGKGFDPAENLATLKSQLANSIRETRIDLNQMELCNRGVYFIFDWNFPHGIINMQPEERILFTYDELKPYLRSDGPLSVFAPKH